MMNELQTTGAQELATRPLRVRCKCFYETCYPAGPNAWEHFKSLLERDGWRLGVQPLCPACVKKKARAFKDKFLEE